MKIHIKNMVCDRCKMVVSQLFEEMGLNAVSVELGEVTLSEHSTRGLDSKKRQQLADGLKKYGFELLENTNGQLVEKIKSSCLSYLDRLSEHPEIKLSEYISNSVHRDYRHLSNLFSSVEGLTIEQYFIRLRIEKVKELLIYSNDSISNIALNFGFSSAAHLSAQFKKVTGLTPSYFKNVREDRNRISLDKL